MKKIFDRRKYGVRAVTAILLCGIFFWGQFPAAKAAPAAPAEDRSVRERYQEYLDRLEAVETVFDMEGNGLRLLEGQVFNIRLQNFGEVTFLPALDTEYHRLVLFLADENGHIVYRTEQLEANYVHYGELEQTNTGDLAVSFQDVDRDGRTDIVLLSFCADDTARSGRKKVGDVLFAGENGFYRDWRISDKLNRYGMNKSVDLILAYARDHRSTEFLYTADTQEELLAQGFEIFYEQRYARDFEKLGRLWVVPGEFRIADFEIFMIYLVNEQGEIVWSFSPMGEYDNLYAFRGINCRDIDGDGMKDIVVLARYSREGAKGLTVESDYAIYYQRTGGFVEEQDFKSQYVSGDNGTMEDLIRAARAYWGWSMEEEP